jgi:Fic family protein
MFCKDCHNKGKYEGYITTKQGKHIVVSNKNQRSTNKHNPKTRKRSHQEVNNGNETVTFTTTQLETIANAIQNNHKHIPNINTYDNKHLEANSSQALTEDQEKQMIRSLFKVND